jgi:NAD(P)-dependent dehydrogenase (short-subunit alcohol dehydrogenase family)
MRTLLLIGAGPGIGLAVAKKFAGESYSVAALLRKGDITGWLGQKLPAQPLISLTLRLPCYKPLCELYHS